METKRRKLVQTTLIPFLCDWSMIGSVKVANYKFTSLETKIAAFDFDGTIACLNGSHTFPKSGSDWRWFDSSVPSILFNLIDLGYSLVILSNQSGIQKQLKRNDCFVGRIEKTVAQLIKHAEGKPFGLLVLAATENDVYRKPRIGMWPLLNEMFKGIVIDLANSFYVGDAAGRKLQSNAKKDDHADTDLKLALNLGIRFFVPEQIFHHDLVPRYAAGSKLCLQDCPPLDKLSFQPREIVDSQKSGNAFTEHDFSGYHLLILVGSPAAGKSFFTSRHLSKFLRVNQDTLKTLKKCEAAATKAMINCQPVVIDNTNPSKATRNIYLKAASECDTVIKAACILFRTPEEIVRHNNLYRTLIEAHGSLPAHTEQVGKMLPDIAFNTFKSKFEEPTLEEGFDKIFEVTFQPQEDQTNWSLYWL